MRSAGSTSALRGAPIPTGDDVLLAPEKDVYLLGDAAGLVSAFHSAGIHYALGSALVLASSLVGGTPYGEALAPLAKSLKDEADNVVEAYASHSRGIAASGEAI